MMNTCMALALACSSAFLVLDATTSAAEAMPLKAGALADQKGDVAPIMYRMHHKWRSSHHNAPNYYCRSQPSRC